MKRALIFTLPFFTAACTMAENSKLPSPDTCGASNFVSYLNEHIDDVPAELKDRDLIRILPPNSIVTLDFIEKRLNVHLGNSGKILKLACG